jgi:hypothetical protein
MHDEARGILSKAYVVSREPMGEYFAAAEPEVGGHWSLIRVQDRKQSAEPGATIAE